MEKVKKTAPRPVENLPGRFQHFASDAEKQRHLSEVQQAQRDGAKF